MSQNSISQIFFMAGQVCCESEGQFMSHSYNTQQCTISTPNHPNIAHLQVIVVFYTIYFSTDLGLWDTVAEIVD